MKEIEKKRKERNEGKPAGNEDRKRSRWIRTEI